MDWIQFISKLKKYKNPAYKSTPLGIFFPASVKNDTEQFFLTCRQLNVSKKCLTNSKIYGLLGIIDLKKWIIGKKLKNSPYGLMQH